MTGEVLLHESHDEGWHYATVTVIAKSGQVLGMWKCWNCREVGMTSRLDDALEARRIAIEGVKEHRTECRVFHAPY
ncbi:MAG: hypothetical protein IT428_18050 [Planctomycetaceae bacterium]|nr:hypothetical protein [Planctomycetaceae bacterium]